MILQDQGGDKKMRTTKVTTNATVKGYWACPVHTNIQFTEGFSHPETCDRTISTMFVCDACHQSVPQKDGPKHGDTHWHRSDGTPCGGTIKEHRTKCGRKIQFYPAS